MIRVIHADRIRWSPTWGKGQGQRSDERGQRSDVGCLRSVKRAESLDNGRDSESQVEAEAEDGNAFCEIGLGLALQEMI